jgi:hypothetical protein
MGERFERLVRFGRNAERFAQNDWNGEQNAEWFARNNWNVERNAERFARVCIYCNAVTHFINSIRSIHECKILYLSHNYHQTRIFFLRISNFCGLSTTEET